MNLTKSFPRVVRGAAVLAVAASIIVSIPGCTLLPSSNMFSRVIQPTIKPSSSEQGNKTVTRRWSFEDGHASITVPVDRAVYAGAITAEKNAIFIGGADTTNWIADYYRAFISESHQEAFYSAMLDSLHAVRRRDGLDSAQYVELVTTMAQGLEYRTDAGALAPKFPIETFGDGFGDCDDKTPLAAALLSRDGYDVCLLLFDRERHVSLGIRAPGVNYKRTGYAYVELTDYSLVGFVPDELAGGVHLTSQPQVIKIGSGHLAYNEGGQIKYIERRLADIRTAEERGRARIDSDKTELAREESALQAEREAINGITDPSQQMKAVERYNARVAQANDLAAEANQRIARYNEIVSVERYVARHPAARPQIYSKLRALRL